MMSKTVIVTLPFETPNTIPKSVDYGDSSSRSSSSHGSSSSSIPPYVSLSASNPEITALSSSYSNSSHLTLAGTEISVRICGVQRLSAQANFRGEYPYITHTVRGNSFGATSNLNPTVNLEATCITNQSLKNVRGDEE